MQELFAFVFGICCLSGWRKRISAGTAPNLHLPCAGRLFDQAGCYGAALFAACLHSEAQLVVT